MDKPLLRTGQTMKRHLLTSKLTSDAADASSSACCLAIDALTQGGAGQPRVRRLLFI
jgi:hypothetical protein